MATYYAKPKTFAQVGSSLRYLDDNSGGSSSSVYALWKAKGDNSGTSLANTAADIGWNSWAIDGGSDVTILGADVTIATAGTYKFTVTLRVSGNNRVELYIRTFIDTGSGYTQDTDEIVSDYVLRDTDQLTGSVTLTTALALDAGDDIKWQGEGNADGTCTALDPGTILLVERIA